MKTGLIPYKKTADCQKTAALFIKKDYIYMEFSSLQNLFDYAKRDRYMVTDAEWEESKHPRDESGQFASRNGDSEKKQGAAAKLRDEFNRNTNKYLNTDFRNKSTGINARFSNESQREIRSRTNNTKENGFTLQEHFEVANQIKELFEDSELIKEHSDTKHNQTNVRIERFLSQPIKLKSGKEARACITVKHSLDRNGHNIYSLEAMDIKNALEKTRAKGQPKDSDCPHADNITHDTAEVKSIAGLWRMIKSA